MKTLIHNSKANQTSIHFNKAKLLFLGLFIFFNAFKSSAQFVLEPFSGKDDFILESWYFNTIDSARKVSLFALNEVKYNYDAKQSNLLSYGLIGYDLKNGFGVVSGWRISEHSTSALAGFQYGYYRKDFLAYVVVNTELKRDPSMEAYTLLQYRKKLNKKLKGFSQFQSSTNFTNDGHTFSLHRLRLGLDFGKIQAGVGLENTLVGEDYHRTTAPGVFVRLELY